jgi:hypothetical protein
MTFVHCNHLTDQELKLIADNGGTVSLGVHCEMNSTAVGEIPFHRLLQTGIRPSLSGDTETKCTGDMFSQMRMLWAYHRSTLTRIGPERDAQMPTVTMRDILGYAPIEGAKAIGQETEIGSLTPGKRADILLIDSKALNLGPIQDPVASIVLAAHEGNVRHVLVGGKFVKRIGSLVGVTTENLMDGRSPPLPIQPPGAGRQPQINGRNLKHRKKHPTDWNHGGSTGDLSSRVLPVSQHIRKLVHVHRLRRLEVDHQHLITHFEIARFVERVGVEGHSAAEVGQHDFTDSARPDASGHPPDLACQAPVNFPGHQVPLCLGSLGRAFAFLAVLKGGC